jgi:hypothetical protein
LPQWVVLLFFHFFDFSLHSFNCSFAWLSFSSFSGAFLFASSWFANLSFSFWSCYIFGCTISNSLSTSWSSSSWASCSMNRSRAFAVFSALAFCRASSFALHSWSVVCEDSGVREILLSSSWWCSSWSVLVGTFFLDFFCGVQKSEGVPELESYERGCTIHERQGDKESPKVCTHLKSCEPLYTCPRAPFYRETKGLLHSENTLESKEYP